MQTTPVDLVATEWTLISEAEHTCIFDVKSAGVVLVHFNESNTAPAIDAASVEVQSWPATFDFMMTGMAGNQHIWARAKASTVPIVVIK